MLRWLSSSGSGWVPRRPGCRFRAPVAHNGGDGNPDRPKDDGVPKKSQLRKLVDLPPVQDGTVVVYKPLGAPSPAVYGEDITVVPDYADGSPGPDALETPPTCDVSQAVKDANYAAGDYVGGLTCDGAVPIEGFTVIPQPVTADITITPAPLSVTASSADSAYGTVPAITPTYEGFQRGDTPDQLTTQASCTTTATTTSSPGPFTSSCANAVSKNYTFSYIDGAVNIVAAALTITPSNGTATYGTVPTITPNFTGLVNGTGSLTTQPTCVTTATAATGAGSYTDSTSCSGAAEPELHDQLRTLRHHDHQPRGAHRDRRRPVAPGRAAERRILRELRRVRERPEPVRARRHARLHDRGDAEQRPGQLPAPAQWPLLAELRDLVRARHYQGHRDTPDAHPDTDADDHPDQEPHSHPDADPDRHEHADPAADTERWWLAALADHPGGRRRPARDRPDHRGHHRHERAARSARGVGAALG